MNQLNPGKIEVELKARLDHPGQVEKEIIKKAKPVGEFIEEDIYFTFANTTGYQKQRFRLRRVQGKAIVTVKIEGEAEPGVEANQEFEFEVSDPQAFKVFCQEFGFRVLIEKKKRVKRFLFIPPEDEFPEKNHHRIKSGGKSRIFSGAGNPGGKSKPGHLCLSLSENPSPEI